MEAIIISLLLLFSDIDLSWENANQTQNSAQEHNSAYQDEYADNNAASPVECSAGGKMGSIDLIGY